VTNSLYADLNRALDRDGPLDRATALALLDRAAELMRSADFAEAARHYQRVIGFNDLNVTAAAMLGLGEALYRMDRDNDALAAWEDVTRLPETPSTYPAWRNVAGGRVRNADYQGAIVAYREAERRAPAEDKGEIANRLGWLAKETGNTRAAGRYFARARGDVGLQASVVILGVTAVISLMVLLAPDGGGIRAPLLLNKPAIADGEIWRLWTVTLVHGNFIHLFFNMYALWLGGPIVERMYGRGPFLALYLLFAAAGSLATFAFGDAAFGVGASGAVFGLFGLLFAASRIHHPVIDRQSRALIGQIGFLLVINLALGFFLAGVIDNFAHIGGLIAGLWIGFLFPPGRVPTLRSMWQRPAAVPGAAAQSMQGGPTPAMQAMRVVGVIALLGLMFALWVVGLGAWG
jgi:membrane associated rhomboid family serine protease